MQFSPPEIKQKLLRALDEDNNVLDMPAVFEVISILENYPITREALEQTRIGRYVNELRKKTNNEDLAKRAKRLVRSWQKLISPHLEPSSVNGEQLNNSQTLPMGSTPTSPAFSATLSPALPNKSNSSGYAKSSLSANVSSSPSLRQSVFSVSGITQNVMGLHSVDPNNIQRSVLSHVTTCAVRPLTTAPCKESQPRLSSGINIIDKDVESCSKSKPESPMGNEQHCAVQDGNLSKHVSFHMERHAHKNHSNDSVDMTSKLIQKKNDKKDLTKSNRKRTCSQLGEPPAKRLSDVDKDFSSKKMTVNGIVNTLHQSTELSDRTKRGEVSAKSRTVIVDNALVDSSDTGKISSKRNANALPKSELDKLKEKTKTSKVKTTAQLIAELQAKSGSTHLKSEIIEKIKKNQIEKEIESDLLSVSNSKNRKRHYTSSCEQYAGTSGIGTLSQTKTELVQKYLQTSVGIDDMNLYKCESLSAHSTLTNDQCKLAAAGSNLAENLSSFTHMSCMDIYNMLPPLNLENINWDDDKYEISKESPVTDNDVDRLHNEPWLGVNGTLDRQGSWQDWGKTISLESYGGDTLHVLPYVNIND